MGAWKRLKLGAGGFVMAMSISADGVCRVIATDAGGALVLNNTTGLWEQLIAYDRITNGDISPTLRENGSYGVAAAPSDNTRLYVLHGASAQTGWALTYLYRSNDGGLTLSRTAFAGTKYTSPNNVYRQSGPKIAVDPANKNVLVFNMYAEGYVGSIPIASPAIVTLDNNFSAGQAISFYSNGGVVPTGVTAGQTYYVLATGLSTSVFRFSATPGGAAINVTGAGSGSLYCTVSDTFISSDGGDTCTVLPNYPRSSISGGSVGIVFDPSSSVVGGKTQGIYAFANGSGLWHSTDGGASFSQIASSPTNIQHGKIALDGVYYAIDFDLDKLRRYNGSWTDITPAGMSSINYGTVCTSTFIADVQKVFLMDSGGSLIISTDRGATWGSLKGKIRVATDVPWLANTNENYMSCGDLTMDPLVQNELWFSEGIGVWYSTSQASSNVTWNSKSAGIEELVTNQIISPPGGVPIIACWDRPLFTITNPDVYPSNHGPNEIDAINVASSIDWTTTTPSSIVTNVNRFTAERSGISTDGGATWTDYTGLLGPGAWPYGGLLSGATAASSPTTAIRVQGNQGDVWYTRDGGATWTKITIVQWGNGVADGSGWYLADYLWRQNVCADRVLADTFYIHNWQTVALGGGIYQVTFPSGVLTISRQSTNYANPAPSAFNLQMSCPQGISGNVWITSGEGQSTSSGLQRSKTNGSTWTQITNVGEVYCFGFGKAAPGKDHPSVYMVGFYNSVFGVWRADANIAEWDANAVVWTSLGAQPLYSAALMKTIVGDSFTYGRVYVGSNTDGCYYYGDSSAPTGPRDDRIVGLASSEW